MAEKQITQNTSDNCGKRILQPTPLVEKLAKLDVKRKMILKEGWLAHPEDRYAFKCLSFLLPGIEIEPSKEYGGLSVMNSEERDKIIEFSFRPPRKPLPENAVIIDSRSNIWPGPEAHVAAEEGRAFDSSSLMYDDFLDSCPHVKLANGFKLMSQFSTLSSGGWGPFKSNSAIYFPTKASLEQNLIGLMKSIQWGIFMVDEEKIKAFVIEELETQKNAREIERKGNSIFSALG